MIGKLEIEREIARTKASIRSVNGLWNQTREWKSA